MQERVLAEGTAIGNQTRTSLNQLREKARGIRLA